jgi:hypothetical protein
VWGGAAGGGIYRATRLIKMPKVHIDAHGVSTATSVISPGPGAGLPEAAAVLHATVRVRNDGLHAVAPPMMQATVRTCHSSRQILAEMYLCHTCSYHETEPGTHSSTCSMTRRGAESPPGVHGRRWLRRPADALPSRRPRFP